MAASRKFRNVAGDGRAAFVIDDVVSTDPWRVRFLEIRGRAEAISEPSDSASAMDGPIIRIHPDKVLSLALRPGEQDLEPRQVRLHTRTS